MGSPLSITPRFLKPLDAVKYSGLSIATIRRHIAAKSFKSGLVGKVRLIDRESLDGFIESTFGADAPKERTVGN